MAKRRRRKKGRRGHYIRGDHISPKAGLCKHRSGWELAYMKWLDENVDVTSYTYEKVVIPYVSNVRSGRIRRYFPDFQIFYADGHVEIVEVKPLKRTLQATVVKKSLAAQDWCANNSATYRIVTEVDLKALGLL